jgi:hypothetical protein
MLFHHVQSYKKFSLQDAKEKHQKLKKNESRCEEDCIVAHEPTPESTKFIIVKPDSLSHSSSGARMGL